MAEQESVRIFFFFKSAFSTAQLTPETKLQPHWYSISFKEHTRWGEARRWRNWTQGWEAAGLNLVRSTTFYLLAPSPYWHCSSSTKSVNGDGKDQETRKYKCVIPLACRVQWQCGAWWWCGTLLLLLCGEIHATLIRHRALVLSMFLTSAITTDTATALLLHCCQWQETAPSRGGRIMV